MTARYSLAPKDIVTPLCPGGERRDDDARAMGRPVMTRGVVRTWFGRACAALAFGIVLLSARSALAEPVRLLVAVSHRRGLAAERPLKYADADATFHEAEQIQAHLQLQDDAVNALLDKVEKLEAALAKG